MNFKRKVWPGKEGRGQVRRGMVGIYKRAINRKEKG